MIPGHHTLSADPNKAITVGSLNLKPAQTPTLTLINPVTPWMTL